uniref:DUF445 domain-containing protein n=1 Tax=Odontella aurita TaxID=265563 RepID=A0A7S4I8T5_9STRA|mmetsp:Transcript_21533/g.63086  ORF Transcript_21533/g.63086 Transcript_21533/m.63086 type:complete len:576 (+) Transcript_21533:211-1938(+)
MNDNHHGRRSCSTRRLLFSPLAFISYVSVFLHAETASAFTPSHLNVCRQLLPYQSPFNRPAQDSLRNNDRRPTWLTTQVNGGEDGSEDKHNLRSRISAPFKKAAIKFRARPGTYLLIPFIAAFVGWFTNWLAVQMIFYPVEYRGINIYRRPEVPLGFLGWQGIVPCKTRKMSESMVHMVTTQLLDVQEVFRRLDPRKVADLLAPEVPKLGQGVLDDIVPAWLAGIPRAVLVGLPSQTQMFLDDMNHKFLRGFTIAMQDNIESLLSVRNCVVDQMMADRSLLGMLFRKCGQKELDFLTNSGLWFGFLLGLIQMVVALFWDNPWSLSIGGLIVGLATNWLALKWIFEPVNPTRFGPFVLQGMFLKRQKEVAAEFSSFFAKKILTSEKLWHSILTDPQTTPAFHELFSKHLIKFAVGVTGALRITPDLEMLQMGARRAIGKLPQHIGVLHSYVDHKLGLEEALRKQMELMSCEQFERVLHPIFEEDELTLILAGGVLGFAAGLIQQGLETGQLKMPHPKEVWNTCWQLPGHIRRFSVIDAFRSTVCKLTTVRSKFIRQSTTSDAGASQDDKKSEQNET